MSDLKQLKKIEKIIGQKLEPCPADESVMNFGSARTYLLNNEQKIIGLNLRSRHLEKLIFYKVTY